MPVDPIGLGGSADTDVRQTLQTSLSRYDPALSKGELTYLGSGIESRLFKLSLSDREIAIKVPMVRFIENDNDQGLDAFDLLRQEYAIAEYLSHQGFPVAAPYSLHLPDHPDGLGFLAMQFIECDRSVPSLHDLGAMVASLHAVRPPEIVPVAQRLDTWQKTVSHLIKQRTEVVQKLTAQPIWSPSQEILAEVLSEDRDAVALLHMDVRLDNILCKEKEILALVDWSNALIGPPRLELYRIAEYGLFGPEFAAGYGRKILDDDATEALSLAYRLYTATMLAVVFLSEAPDPVKAENWVARVTVLYQYLRESIGQR